MQDDVFTGEQYEIVDFDVLEKAKENVQPLATGRRVTTLSQVLSTPHAQREAKLSATRNRLRINVELSFEDEDGDPLEAYSRLVNWTLENYPQGHTTESGLLELLEEATRVLKDHRGGKWKQEMKYLKLWLLYASYVEKPTVIYRFMIANEIGTNFALLYEEFAAVLERDGRKKDADDIYTLGMARKATPLDHLQNRYSEFQKRMLTNAVMPTASSITPSSTIASTSETRTSSGLQRTALATSRLALTSSSSSHAVATPQRTNSRLQVFVDPSGAEPDSADSVAGSAWPDLGTRKSRIKENIPEVKKLAGTTLKQSSRSKRAASGNSGTSNGAASTSGIVPYRDPDPTELSTPTPKSKRGFRPFVDSGEMAETAPPPTPAAPSFTPFRDEDIPASTSSSAATDAESVIKVKKAGMKQSVPTSEAEALRKAPLKNYELERDVTAFDDGTVL